jgi:hypothetical protein
MYERVVSEGGLEPPFWGAHPYASDTLPTASDQPGRLGSAAGLCIRYASECTPSSSTVSSTGRSEITGREPARRGMLLTIWEGR